MFTHNPKQNSADLSFEHRPIEACRPPHDTEGYDKEEINVLSPYHIFTSTLLCIHKNNILN